MRIVILSFNYFPDIGPCSLRAKSIVEALLQEGPPDLKIEVITTMPSRYNSFRASTPKKEKIDNLIINRIKIPKHKNGIIDQSIAFLIYSLKVRKLLKNKKSDLIFATSSRLMTASLAAIVAKQSKSKLYLDIRDIFTETINDTFNKNFIKIFMPLIYLLEKWTFNSANKINVVSEGFLDFFKKKVPNKIPSVYTNGVDEIFIKKNFSIPYKNAKTLILYAGNIGHCQALHKIIPQASNELNNINFRLIGDGSRLNHLTKNLIKSNNNIEILKTVPRIQLLDEYKKADILFLHLDSKETFLKVLPSKIFEYAATGKPILAGVSGYAENFLRDNIKGVEIFNPCNFLEMKIALKKLLDGPKIFNRKDFCEIYNRKNITRDIAKDILLLIN